jgi:hypothetical protein
MSMGSDTLTAHVLSVTHAAGLSLPDEVRERTLAALGEFVDGRLARDGPLRATDLAVRKLAALDALSRFGRAQASQLGTIAIEPDRWPLSAMLDWRRLLGRVPAIPDAEARRAEAEARSLAAAFAEAEASCKRARAVAERQTTSILPRAEESARTLERTFQLGEAGILDVIDARRVLLEARRESLSSARDRDVSCGALFLLAGRESP